MSKVITFTARPRPPPAPQSHFAIAVDTKILGTLLLVHSATTMAGKSGRKGQMSPEEKREFLANSVQHDEALLSSLSVHESTILTQRKHQHQPEGGCLACGKDDDHNNLMFCDICDNEYHYYCLDPPLKAVPKGDWFCIKCKPAHKAPQPKEDDGLDPLVCALPPRFTQRFGEICWAQGGSGFGWWPSCIYDPRLTTGGARELARKNLGKRHLVYFFECLMAPFAVLTDKQLVPWEVGLAENHHLGRAASVYSKARGKMFQQALQMACLEEGKPIDLRMIWNHQGEEPIEHIPLSPPGKRPAKKRRTQKEPSDKQEKKHGGKKGGGSSSSASSARANLMLSDEVFCRITKRTFDESGKDIDENLGFVTLDSRDATFKDTRAAIQEEMDPDSLPPNEWKFFLPPLGRVSHRQEGRLGSVASYLLRTFQHRLGCGTVDDPFHIVIVEVKKLG
jgi:hypothetical protein